MNDPTTPELMTSSKKKRSQYYFFEFSENFKMLVNQTSSFVSHNAATSIQDAQSNGSFATDCRRISKASCFRPSSFNTTPNLKITLNKISTIYKFQFPICSQDQLTELLLTYKDQIHLIVFSS